MTGKTKRTKKPYLDNNWDMYAAQPDDFFIPIEFDDFMDWKGQCWELPSTVVCLIREETVTGKIKEHVYRREGSAKNKIRKLLERDAVFTVCKHDAIHDVNPDYDTND